jgi:hypothetical protein
MKQIFTFSFLLMLCLAANAQVIWNFGTAIPGNASPSSGIPANLTVSVISQGNNNGTTTLLQSTSASSGYTGASASFNATAAIVGGAFNAASSTYFEVTLTPGTGFQVSVSNIQFGTRSTATGPTALNIRSSVDAYAADVTTQAVSANSTWALVNPAISTPINGVNDQAVTIRIYGAAGTGATSTANWRIDDLQISVTLNVLPVRFERFTARYDNNNTVLNWTAAASNGYFEVQRSANGIAFENMGIVTPANGNQYSYIDRNAPAGNDYYRIAWHEAGRVQYSGVLKVNRDEQPQTGFKIVANNTTGNLQLLVNSSATHNTSFLNIIDMNGRRVQQLPVALQQGTQLFNTNVSSLTTGHYIATMVIDGKTYSSRFVKQ